MGTPYWIRSELKSFEFYLLLTNFSVGTCFDPTIPEKCFGESNNDYS